MYNKGCFDRLFFKQHCALGNLDEVEEPQQLHNCARSTKEPAEDSSKKTTTEEEVYNLRLKEGIFMVVKLLTKRE